MKERIVIDFKDLKCAEDINYTIAKNKTMFQMFQFIKSLIGEE